MNKFALFFLLLVVATFGCQSEKNRLLGVFEDAEQIVAVAETGTLVAVSDWKIEAVPTVATASVHPSASNPKYFGPREVVKNGDSWKLVVEGQHDFLPIGMYTNTEGGKIIVLRMAPVSLDEATATVLMTAVVEGSEAKLFGFTALAVRK